MAAHFTFALELKLSFKLHRVVIIIVTNRGHILIEQSVFVSASFCCLLLVSLIPEGVPLLVAAVSVGAASHGRAALLVAVHVQASLAGISCHSFYFVGV